jgi:hypothetical protein
MLNLTLSLVLKANNPPSRRYATKQLSLSLSATVNIRQGIQKQPKQPVRNIKWSSSYLIRICISGLDSSNLINHFNYFNWVITVFSILSAFGSLCAWCEDLHVVQSEKQSHKPVDQGLSSCFSCCFSCCDWFTITTFWVWLATPIWKQNENILRRDTHVSLIIATSSYLSIVITSEWNYFGNKPTHNCIRIAFRWKVDD